MGTCRVLCVEQKVDTVNEALRYSCTGLVPSAANRAAAAAQRERAAVAQAAALEAATASGPEAQVTPYNSSLFTLSTAPLASDDVANEQGHHHHHHRHLLVAASNPEWPSVWTVSICLPEP